MSAIQMIRSIAPDPVWRAMRSVYYKVLLVTGRSRKPAETTKAQARRQREGFFEKFCKGEGLDIGYGGDLIVPNAKGWDIEHGDAQYLRGQRDGSLDFVYSSHTLEHVVDPAVALQNWYRVLRPGGYLMVYIPHRDLYEKKRTLPSNWNPDHKTMFLPDRDEAPDTVGVSGLIARTLPDAEVIYIKTCDEGHTITDPNVHSDGEYSIEFVLRKPLRS